MSPNTTQNSSDNLPSYLQETIIAQLLSIGGEGAIILRVKQKIITLKTTIVIVTLATHCAVSLVRNKLCHFCSNVFRCRHFNSVLLHDTFTIEKVPHQQSFPLWF